MTAPSPASRSEIKDVFSFNWAKDKKGYKLFSEKNPSECLPGTAFNFMNSGAFVWATGGKCVEYVPRETTNLHRQFAAVGDSPEEVLEFIKKYGFLDCDIRAANRGIGIEYVGEILSWRDRVREVLTNNDDLNRKEARAVSYRRERAESGDPMPEGSYAGFRMLSAHIFNVLATPRLKVKLTLSSDKNRLAFALNHLLFLPVSGCRLRKKCRA